MQPLNPPRTLSSPPIQGCLPEKDGREFSDFIQVARLAANAIGRFYPNVRDIDQLAAAYRCQEGQVVLAHLNSVMYSYWNSAPTGPSVFELTRDHLPDSLRQVFVDYCKPWGQTRLNAPVDGKLCVITDTPEGSIVSDHTMTKFYRVLGLKRSPATSLLQSGVELPAMLRLSAVPFRGVLVYDGVMCGIKPEKLCNYEARRIQKRYAEAKRKGKVITGFHADGTSTANSAQLARPSRQLSDLCDEEKKMVQELKDMPKSDYMLVFCRHGYTESENPEHVVVIRKDQTTCNTFQCASLIPSAVEIVRELVNHGKKGNHLPKQVSVDDVNTAAAVSEITKHAGILASLYPAPSVEERSLLSWIPPPVFDCLKNFDGTSAFPSGNGSPSCPVQ